MDYYIRILEEISKDIVYISREGNDIADALAKSGVSRLYDLVVVYD